MPSVSVNTDDPGLREEIHRLFVTAEQGRLSPAVITQKVLNLLVTYAHLSNDEVTAEEVNYYTNLLIDWISRTLRNGKPESIEAIRSLWDDESWDSIQDKLLTDASI
jgi:hypothetical protein